MTERTDDALLDGILAAYQMHAKITDNMRYCGKWKDSDPQAPVGTAWFHLLDQGECWMEIEGLDGRLKMGPGDLVVLARGNAHVLTPVENARGRIDRDGFTTMLCGEFQFESASGHPVMDALPEVMHVKGEGSGGAYRQLATLLVEEANQGGFGSQAVMDKLADALFVMALRQFLQTTPTRRGLFAALSDPRLRKALDVIHNQPGKEWTVASLAEVACLSRTAFAERFAEVLKETPYQYLTRWRMAQALKLLRDPQLSVAHVAERLGYQTEAAFRRSFKRVHGFGPGVVRRKASLAAGEQEELE